ncbi:MAG: alpha/beta fold hydrolase, partial [Gammaproteobacteria bacterium]|nr:alpha/beta fold hydrolase [Gammaproteobacteria bacterium]
MQPTLYVRGKRLPLESSLMPSWPHRSSSCVPPLARIRATSRTQARQLTKSRRELKPRLQASAIPTQGEPLCALRCQRRPRRCDNRRMRHFDPPVGLASPHLQTILARIPAKTGDAPSLRLENATLECRDNARLEARVSTAPAGAPLVTVIHGWLGDSGSWYVQRTVRALKASGFRVACLLLRDHGGTASCNREMFNSARIGEVLDACNTLVEQYSPASAGIMGFSLGGNFALRLACHADLDHRLVACLAVSPVI